MSQGIYHRHQDITGKASGERYGRIAAGRISSGCPPACFSPRFLPLRVNHRLKRGKNQRECAARPSQSESECRSQDPILWAHNRLSQPRHRALPAIRKPPGYHSMPGVKLPEPRPAVRPEATEDLVRKFFPVLLFAILRPRAPGRKNSGNTVRFPTDILH